MANNGVISVELKLALSSLQAQVKKASSMLNFKGAEQAADTNKATAAQDKQTKSVKETNAALKEQARLAKAAALASAQADVDRLRAAREQAMRQMRAPAWMGSEQAQKFTDPEEAAALAAEAERLRNLRRLGRQSNTGAGLASNPLAMFGTPPILPASGTPGKTSGVDSKLVGIGKMLASYYLITRAINFAIAPLRKFANEMERAAAAAAKTYTSSMSSGMGLGMTVRRGTLAQIIGVSENDIFQFGAAIKYIQPQIENAQKILTATNGPLTQMEWQFKILQTNLSALVAKISTEAAPAINLLTLAIDGMVQAITNHVDLIMKLAAKAAIFAATSNDPALRAVVNTVTAIMGGPIGSMLKSVKGSIPSPQAWMKQMPASTWEHMGLQVGGAGGTDYQRQTAMNTAQMNQSLKQILKQQFQNLNNVTQPAGLGGLA